MKKVKVLITGGAGYIGSKLADVLLASGYSVVIVDNLASGKKENIPSKAKVYVEDICSLKFFEILKKETPDILFHLAASKSVNDSLENPIEFSKINILGSLNVIDSAYKLGIKKIIFTSTAGAYGDQFLNKKQYEDQAPDPSSPYAWTKLTIEEYIFYMNKYHGMQGLVLRFANVYGPGGQSPYKSVIDIFIDNVLTHKPIIVHGDGTQTRDFIFIDDLIALCSQLVEIDFTLLHEKPLFNVSTGKEVSVETIIQIISVLTQQEIKLIYESSVFAGQKRSSLDTKKTKKILGWQAMVTIEKGIKKTIDFIKMKENL